MLETILRYLEWAVPGGLGAALGWLASSRLRNARVAKEVHDIYKTMYDDVSRELQAMRKENEKLYQAVSRLTRAILRANQCRYWSGCPIRDELPDTKSSGTNNHPGRHPQLRQHRIRDSGDRDAGRSRGLGEPDGADGGDSDPPRRR